MSACQHPGPQIGYAKDGALICTACGTELVPGELNPDMYLAIGCPSCGAARFWFCQRGHGRSCGAHPERTAALWAQRHGEVTE